MSESTLSFPQYAVTPFVGANLTLLFFMFMVLCIFIYEDHINNQRDATFYALY